MDPRKAKDYPPDNGAEVSDSAEEPGSALDEEGAVSSSSVEPAAPPVISPEAARQIAELRRGLAAKDSQLKQVVEAYRSIKKETEKLRHRIEQHQRRRFELSKGDFIGRFVEVLDDLDRAIDAIENSFDADAVLQGIILVRSRLVQLLREEGLEKIFVGGQPFDPTHSEAAAIEPVEDESQDNTVLRELQRGYMLKGSLLRPARVVVGRFERTREDAGIDSSAPPASSSNDEEPEGLDLLEQLTDPPSEEE